jgi:Mg2+-importing ATPase
MATLFEPARHDAERTKDVHGLTSSEAAERLSQFGWNDPLSLRVRSPWADLTDLLANPLTLILLIAAIVSAVAGERANAILIIGIVLIGTGIDFSQTYRSRRIIEHLRATVATLATAKRDGSWQDIPRKTLVPGDLIRLAAGDLIPADAQLVEAHDLYVQQASLTGESAPTEKSATSDSASRSADAPNMVFLGTSVVSGTAIAVVTATGSRSAFGFITARITAHPPETAFDRGLRQFGYLITQVVFLLVLFVLTVSIILHRNPLDSLLFAVALAVGLTPEFLPMITSVTLSRGALAMARRHVVVKHLPAIENLGSIDILCSDKTGTLTSGMMGLKDSLAPDGQPSARPLDLAYINSALQTGIRSPLDAAILAAASQEVSGERCDEIPFDFQRRRLSVILQQGDRRILICKGSPEGILPLVSAIETRTGSTEPVTQEKLQALSESCSRLSAQGLRVLAVALREVPIAKIYSEQDESCLTLAGYLSFADPILPDTAETIATLREDGVAVKILSGDNDQVTAHICTEAGVQFSRVVLGQEIDGMSDPALNHVVETEAVFARLSPAQKLRVLNALKMRGHRVGFIGDGINDALCLHFADIGIAAPSAVEVAQDAADVVILQPGLKVIHQGIVEGRRAFGNLMKYLLMGTSSNFGNVISMAAASVVLPFIPMLPTQILLNNFLYDLSQLTIPTDHVDPSYIRNPQHWDIGLVRRFMLWIGPISSLYDFLTFYVLLKVFRAGPMEFHTGWFVESLATQTLVLFIIRTPQSPFRSRPSTALLSTILAIVAVALWLPFSPFSSDLGFSHLNARYFLFLFLATATYLFIVEIAKRHALRLRPHSIFHSGPASPVM